MEYRLVYIGGPCSSFLECVYFGLLHSDQTRVIYTGNKSEFKSH